MPNSAFRARLSLIMILSWSLICSSKARMDLMLISPFSLFPTELGHDIPRKCVSLHRQRRLFATS